MTVLVADDEPIHRMLMETTLKRWGHQVLVASDGAEAWSLLENGARPDLAVLDWNMPGVDGLDLLARIRHDAALASIPVVLLTVRASTVSTDPRAAMASKILVKPWSPRDFREVIESFAAGPSEA